MIVQYWNIPPFAAIMFFPTVLHAIIVPIRFVVTTSSKRLGLVMNRGE
jgi:hypothetical protein